MSVSESEVPEIVIDPSTLKRYSRDELLGQGASGKCYKMTDLLSGDTFAVKVIPLYSWVLDKVYQEVKILKKLQHKNVVGFSHCFEDHQFIYIFMELCSKQTLQDILNARGTLTEPEVRYYMRQLISGLKFIHRRGYVHRDIKLDNLFITEKMELKIGDFGLATKLKPRKKDINGTPGYMAPEVWKREGNGVEADVWALGCVLYELLVGELPFNEDAYWELINDIKEATCSLPKSLSVEAGKLISKILRKNPQDRPTLRKIICHKFFSEGFTPEQLPPSSCNTVPQLKAAQNSSVKFYHRLAQCLFPNNRSRVEPSWEDQMHSSVQVAQAAASPAVESIESRPLTKLTWSSWSQWLSDIQTGCTKKV